MPGGAPMIAPETGRRRTLRHRLARTGSAPRQPRPAQAPAEATAFKLARALADRAASKTMPPRFRTPPEAPLADGTGVDLGQCSMAVKDYFRDSVLDLTSQAR